MEDAIKVVTKDWVENQFIEYDKRIKNFIYSLLKNKPNFFIDEIDGKKFLMVEMDDNVFEKILTTAQS